MPSDAFAVHDQKRVKQHKKEESKKEEPKKAEIKQEEPKGLKEDQLSE